jgi:peroxiredoxin
MYILDARGTLVYAGGHDDVEAALLQVRAGEKVEKPKTKNYGCSVKYSLKAALGLAAPAFELADLDGAMHRSDDLRGRVVVLEWFNPQCPYVVAAHGENGALRDAAARYAERGVVWLAVNSGHDGHPTADPAANARAKELWGMRYPILRDVEGRVGKLFDAKTTPHMYVLDRRGVLVYAGGHDDAESGERLVEKALDEVLAGKPVGQPTSRNYGCGVKYGS